MSNILHAAEAETRRLKRKLEREKRYWNVPKSKFIEIYICYNLNEIYK